MNNSNPINVSDEELREIIDLKEVREMWGLEADEGLDTVRQIIYAAKFDFVSGGPGYVGDVFVLLGDTIEAPLSLVRNEAGQLQVAA